MPELNQSEQKVSRVVSLLQGAHEKLRKKHRLTAVALFTGILMAGLGITVLIESTSYLPGTYKSIILSMLFLTALITTIAVFRRSKIQDFKTFYENLLLDNGRKNTLSAVDLYLDEKQKKSRFYNAALSANLKNLETAQLSGEIKSYTNKQRARKLFRLQQCRVHRIDGFFFVYFHIHAVGYIANPSFLEQLHAAKPICIQHHPG